MSSNQIVNSIGIAFDFFGICFISWQIILAIFNKDVKQEQVELQDAFGVPLGILNQLANQVTKNPREAVGFIMVIVGFVFQFLSNFDNFSNWLCGLFG